MSLPIINAILFVVNMHMSFELLTWPQAVKNSHIGGFKNNYFQLHHVNHSRNSPIKHCMTNLLLVPVPAAAASVVGSCPPTPSPCHSTS